MLTLPAVGAHALEESNPFERRDFDAVASSSTALRAPGNHLRLFLDVYNITDVYDFETNDETGFVDGTWLSDTLRPTFSVLWDDRFRLQLGAVGRKVYGHHDKVDSVDPWVQFAWKPTRPLTVILGNIETPHAYHHALFMPVNYVLESAVENGAQLQYQRENWVDDLFFNYRLQDMPDHAEKFDVGFTHNNAWKFLRFNYQVHWIHEGGTLYRHPVATVNDIAHLFGAGVQFQPASIWIVGAKYSYLTSHLKHSAVDPDNPDEFTYRLEIKGSGRLYEIYTRVSRVKLSLEYWRGINYQHEGSDPWFTVPRLTLATLRWDIFMSDTLNLYLRYSGGLVGANDDGVSRYLMSAVHLQAAWKFSIPLMEWNAPSIDSSDKFGYSVTTNTDDH